MFNLFLFHSSTYIKPEININIVHAKKIKKNFIKERTVFLQNPCLPASQKYPTKINVPLLMGTFLVRELA